jgi:hypothetical protein
VEWSSGSAGYSLQRVHTLQAGTLQASCTLSRSWCWEVFHDLRVMYIQLSLVLYLSQVYLQHLSKVAGSWSWHGLWLCPVRHLSLLLDSPIFYFLAQLGCHQTQLFPFRWNLTDLELLSSQSQPPKCSLGLWEHATIPKYCLRQSGVSRNICTGWPQTMIPTISASQEARIIVVIQHHSAYSKHF